MSAADKPISRAEREDILRVARQREKVAKSAARNRSADLRADFEAKLAAKYSFDQRPVWKAANEAAERAVAEADQRIAEECERLGIPRQFRPGLSIGWYSRGENAAASRRTELRNVATSRIAAIERQAFAAIERDTLVFTTEVLSNGLSHRAKELLGNMPSVDALMPLLDMAEVSAAIDRGPAALLDYDDPEDAP